MPELSKSAKLKRIQELQFIEGRALEYKDYLDKLANMAREAGEIDILAEVRQAQSSLMTVVGKAQKRRIELMYPPAASRKPGEGPQH